MATVHEILNFLFSLAPEAEKEPWDHVGLMVGDRSRPVETVLVALDPFYPVCQEAAARGAQLLVTHHPLFFGGTHAAAPCCCWSVAWRILPCTRISMPPAAA